MCHGIGKVDVANSCTLSLETTTRTGIENQLNLW